MPKLRFENFLSVKKLQKIHLLKFIRPLNLKNFFSKQKFFCPNVEISLILATLKFSYPYHVPLFYKVIIHLVKSSNSPKDVLGTMMAAKKLSS